MRSFRRYRAPRAHGQSLIEPNFSEVGELIRVNRERMAADGPFFDSLRTRARRQLIDDAVRYTSSYRDVGWVKVDDQTPIMMAGHQPALFHPGVWFKNFALSRLAQQTGAIAINLVIDNDVATGCSARVPSLDPETGGLYRATVPYDIAGGGVPYEQTTIEDREVFDHFDVAVRRAVSGIVDQPCVMRLWEHARAAVERCGVAGCALAQARHGLEGELGLRTLELPLGVVCRGTAFAEFVLAILTQLPRFHRCYNDSANEYRRAHRIRSNAHPVPNLAQDGEWFEAPLWIYGNQAPERKAAWVRLFDDHLVLSDRQNRELRIDTVHTKLAAEQLANLVSPNFKLRPRALMTTMYARLVLSDLFLHGIGGGKYDQLGDRIMEAFFELMPAKFMVISVTVLLPGVQQADYEHDIRRLKRQLRDSFYQPERFADRVELESDLLHRKRELLAEVPQGADKRAWHDELTRINSQLAQSLESIRGELRWELAVIQRNATSQNLLASREHPFCIFPLDYLTETFEAMLDEAQAPSVLTK